MRSTMVTYWLLVEMFAQFFKSAVEVTNMRRRAKDAFAVEFQHQAEGGVGRRVLGAEVERPAIAGSRGA